MKARTITFTFLIFFFYSCSDVTLNKINSEDLGQVRQIIRENPNFAKPKQNYIIDRIETVLELFDLAPGLADRATNLPTFKEQIDAFSSDYDSLNSAFLTALENNVKIEKLMKLKDASVVSLGKYEGYLSLTLEFDNEFEKEILYTGINYRYVDEYDTEFFEERAKITDEVANEFEGTADVTIKAEYNDVARFIYGKVPVRARQELIDELGEDEANRKVQREFLMKGLQIETVLVVFKDKSELTYQEVDWKYLDKSANTDQSQRELVEEES
jgi:hypothetical protein